MTTIRKGPSFDDYEGPRRRVRRRHRQRPRRHFDCLDPGCSTAPECTEGDDGDESSTTGDGSDDVADGEDDFTDADGVADGVEEPEGCDPEDTAWLSVKARCWSADGSH